MSLKVWVAGVFKTVQNTNDARIWIGPSVGGAWKSISRMRVWKVDPVTNTGQWKDFYVKASLPPPPPPDPPVIVVPPPAPVTLNVTVSPGQNITASRRSTFEPDTVTTSDVVASASGGTGPYQYQWSRVSWSGSTPTITAPAAATTRFIKNMPYGAVTDTFKVDVVDSLGNRGSKQIQVTFTLSERDWVDTGGTA